MLKVAFLTPSLHVGGAERWIVSLARNFRRCKPVGCFLFGNFFHPKMMAECRRTMPVLLPGEEVRADVFISWGLARLPEVARHVQVPVVDVSHSDGRWSSQTTMVRRSCLGASHLAAVSQAAATAFPKILQDRVTVIPNGVEPERVKPRRGRSKQRADWGIPPDRKVALFLGRFAEVKGPERLLAAAEHLPRQWVIGFVGHGSMEQALKRAADRTAPGRVFFTPPVEHVGDPLAAADVLVMPSRSEGMPLSMIEAWLAGVPVVTTSYPFSEDVVSRHGEVCVISRSAPQALAANIMSIGERLPVMTQRARDVAGEFFTAQRMAQSWERYLQAVTTTTGAGAHQNS